MHNKLTLQDIARIVGISKATVSWVLNHNPSVSILSMKMIAGLLAIFSVCFRTTSPTASNKEAPICVSSSQHAWLSKHQVVFLDLS